MAYCTQTNVENRFASTQWWSDQALAGATNATIVAAAIDSASGEIDRSVMRVYTVPLTLANAGTARAIRDACETLAGWKLAARLPGQIDEALKLEVEEVRKWLELVGKGDVTLPGESAAASGAPTGRPVIVGDPIIVTRDSTDGL